MHLNPRSQSRAQFVRSLRGVIMVLFKV